jgi:putative ABC transport system permease protein
MQIQKVEIKSPVIGIVDRETSPGMFGGAAVSPLMIPLAKARAISGVQLTSAESLLRRPDVRDYQIVTVKVAGAQHTEEVEARIKELGYSAFSVTDVIKGAKRAFILFDILLSVIGGIALAVSSLGIVNTMVMSILERTREIGIMKAIGGSDGNIRRIFLIEASAIGLMGGVGGVLLGWIVGRIINFGANWYIESQGGTAGQLFSMPFWLIASAIGFSIFVSLIAGSYPARRAARLDPIKALRHD